MSDEIILELWETRGKKYRVELLQNGEWYEVNTRTNGHIDGMYTTKSLHDAKENIRNKIALAKEYGEQNYVQLIKR